MNSPRQILGRQPVAFIAVAQAFLMLAVSFHALKFVGINGPDDVMIVSAVLNAGGAVYLALGTTETLLAPIIELFKAVAAFAAIYGLNLSGEQSGLAIVLITATFAFLHQPKTSPQATLAVSGPVLLAPETASPTYDAQAAGGVVSKGEQGNVNPILAGVVAMLLAVATIGALSSVWPASAWCSGGSCTYHFAHHSPDDGYDGPGGQMALVCSNGSQTYNVALYAGQSTSYCEATKVNVPAGADVWCLVGSSWIQRWTATGLNNVPAGNYDCTYRLD